MHGHMVRISTLQVRRIHAAQGSQGVELSSPCVILGDPTDHIICSFRTASSDQIRSDQAHTCLPACMRAALLHGHLAQFVGTKLLPSFRGILAHSASHYTMKVFLDIDIGDREAYRRDLAAYRVTAEFLEQVGSQVMM